MPSRPDRMSTTNCGAFTLNWLERRCAVPAPWTVPRMLCLKGVRTMSKSRRRSPDTPHSEKPLSFEHTLKLRNEPDKDLPEAIKKELSTLRIYLRGIPHRRDVDDYLTSVEEMEATWSIRLPAGASIGLAGRTGDRLDRASVAVAEGTSTAPHRPEWSGVSYQPRVAEPFGHGRKI